MINQSFHSKTDIKLSKHETGLIAVLTVITMSVMILMAGIVFEVGNAYRLNSTLQNGVDAAAIAAASVYRNDYDRAAATAEARKVFNQHVNSSGNTKLAIDFTSVGTVEFIASLQPLQIAGATDEANFVRVSANNISANLVTTFFQIDSFSLSASSVAGLSPDLTNICDISPMLVCAETDPSAYQGDYLGYDYGEVIELKISSNSDSGVGPGNFHLLDTGSGGDAVKDMLAGENSEYCVASGTTVTTLPGDTVGPVAMGLNTRFADAANGSARTDIPPDIVRIDPSGKTNGPNGDVTGGYTAYPDTTNPYHYSDYQDDFTTCLADPSSNITQCVEGGSVGRRILAVIMVDCSADDTSGVAQLPALGFGCFFLPQSLTLKANAGETSVYGELVEECEGRGDFSGPGTPNNNSSVNEIVLYKDPDNGDL